VWALPHGSVLGELPLMCPAVQSFDSIAVGERAATGEGASIQLQLTQFGMSISSEALLRTETGRWRVYALRMTPMPGMSMTMNLENPEAILEDLDQMMGECRPSSGNRWRPRCGAVGSDWRVPWSARVGYPSGHLAALPVNCGPQTTL